MLVAMGLASVLCILIGSFPELLYQMLPWENTYMPYDLTHTLTQLQLLFFSALAFVWLNKMGLYPPELKSVNLDVEYLYRKVLPAMGNKCQAAGDFITQNILHAATSALNLIPKMNRDADASAATLTLRMAIGFVLLALVALVTELM